MSSNLLTNFKKLNTSIFIVFLLELINKIYPIFLIHIIHERIGLENFGTAQLCLSFIEISVPFILFGYESFCAIFLKDYIDQGKEKQLFTTVTFLKVINSILVFSVIYITTSISSSYQIVFSFLPLLIIFYMCIALDSSWVFIALGKVHKLNSLIAAIKVITFSSIYFFIQSGEDTWLYIFLLCSVNASVNIASFLYAYKKLGFSSISIQDIFAITKYSMPFAACSALSIILQRIDLFFVQYLFPAYEFGIYSGISRLHYSLYTFIGSLSMVFFSENIQNKSQKNLESIYHYSSFIFLSFSLPMIAGSWIVEQSFLQMVIGSSFEKYGRTFSLLMLSHIGSIGLTLYGRQILITQKHLSHFIYGILSALSFFILVNFAITDHTLNQIAGTLFLSKFIGATVCLYYSKKYIKNIMNTRNLKIFGITSLMTTAGWISQYYLGNQVTSTIIICAMVYFILWIFLFKDFFFNRH